VRLVALFSPEHGFRGNADPGAALSSSVDSATGLPIYSLYGRTSSPTDEMLEGVDVVLVDLQDAGARYYTYIWTTVGVMRAAARNGKRVIILDRPNPIGGTVEGNVLDTAFSSPVGLLAVPMRHGMTLGELALLAKADFGLPTGITVVPVAGWRRSMYFDATGLPFVPPSPNLRTVESLIHYPGLCLFEGTNLSVGRGSDAPFEQVGAPWLDTTAVLEALRQARVPGVEFSAVTFTPRHPGDGKYADTLVRGIRLRVTDRTAYDPTLTAVTMLKVVATVGFAPGGCDHCQADGGFAWLAPQFDRLAGAGPRLRQAIVAGPLSEVTASWRADRERFLARRAPFLLYGEK
jgi:uncharacterized protein YbbC (DUF1343 family)